MVSVAAAVIVIVAATGAFWAARSLQPERRLQRWVAAVALAVVALPPALIYGPWIYATTRCGRQPVAITNFAAAHSYEVPGDPGYHRSDLFQSYVCSEDEAKAKGYVRSPH